MVDKTGGAGRRKQILFFQLLLFSSIVLGIAAALQLGFWAAVLASTAFCAGAVFHYFRAFGADYRALFLALLFYLLSWFFFSVKFFSNFISIYYLPFFAALVLALLFAFKFLVYNRSGRGRVVAEKDGYVLVEVEESAWHSLSGVQAVVSREHFRPGEEAALGFSPGFFSAPRISKLKPIR